MNGREQLSTWRGAAHAGRLRGNGSILSGSIPQTAPATKSSRNARTTSTEPFLPHAERVNS